MVGERAHALLLLPVLGGVKTLPRLFPPRIARERLSPLLAVGLDLEQRVEDGVSGEPPVLDESIQEVAYAVDGGFEVRGRSAFLFASVYHGFPLTGWPRSHSCFPTGSPIAQRANWTGSVPTLRTENVTQLGALTIGVSRRDTGFSW